MEEIRVLHAFSTYPLLPLYPANGLLKQTSQECARAKAYGAHDIFLKFFIFEEF